MRYWSKMTPTIFAFCRDAQLGPPIPPDIPDHFQSELVTCNCNSCLNFLYILVSLLVRNASRWPKIDELRALNLR
jgi:hypothetical protein